MEQEKESIFREFENRFLRELLDWYKKSKIKKIIYIIKTLTNCTLTKSSLEDIAKKQEYYNHRNG